jgi:hypothetical protein
VSFNGSGTFVINSSGQPVVTNTVISSTAFNALTADLGTGLSTTITKDGQTTTTAKIPFALGLSAAAASNFAAGTVAAPGLYLSTDTGTGLYRIAANNNGFAVSGVKVIDISATGVGFQGTTTNNSAAAGYVGEYVSSAVTATNYGATGVWGDLTSISLTAGDWDVTAVAFINVNGATMTYADTGISVTSGNSSTGLVFGDNYLEINAVPTFNTGISIPAYRISIASTTTVYLKYRAGYSAGGPPTAAGRLSARRVR